jgi:hypothetical protein
MAITTYEISGSSRVGITPRFQAHFWIGKCSPYKHYWLQWFHLSILPIPRYAKAASNVFTAALFSSRSDCVYTSRDTPIPWPR